MITVRYDRPNYTVTIAGHAQSGEPGHDLVCCSVTTLAYTIAVALANDSEAGLLMPGTKIDLGKGRAELRCRPYDKHADVVLLQMDTICAGFDFLAKNLGEYLEYIMVLDG